MDDVEKGLAVMLLMSVSLLVGFAGLAACARPEDQQQQQETRTYKSQDFTLKKEGFGLWVIKDNSSGCEYLDIDHDGLIPRAGSCPQFDHLDTDETTARTRH